MPLYVRDERVNQLAEQARKILNAPTKTDAIRQALEKVVGNDEDREATLLDRIKGIQDEVKKLGKPNPDFDEKAFLDEMWEI